MLLSLAIKNFILIDVAYLNFSQGLSVLSGETGAGKSIILDALGLALGKRANAKYIKDQNYNAVISVEFDITNLPHIIEYLKDNGFDADTPNILILKRVLEPSGKTKCFINDILSNITTMESIGEQLIEISNQHDQKGLFNTSYHRIILDEFSNISEKTKVMSMYYSKWKHSQQKFLEMGQAILRAEDEKNYLTHIIHDLSQLAFQEGEEEQLALLRTRLRDKAKIQEISHVVLEEMNKNDGIIVKLNHILKLLTKIPEVFKQAEERFEVSLIEMQEGIAQVEKIYEALLSEKFDLNSVEERLFNIRNTARKYNILSHELGELFTNTQNKLSQMKNYDTVYQELKSEVEGYKSKYLEVAHEVSQIRKQNALSLEIAVKLELQQLKMGYADFKIDIITTEEYSEQGIDKVKFLARTNPNSEFDYINKIASGGELSRIFLSLRVALAKYKSCPTIIFDEIDIGVGGAVADSIGKKLLFLSQMHQVLVITHQPQIAAYSNHHYLVQKQFTENNAQVAIHLLDKQQKIQEIARMLSGENITNESISAATILIDKAHTNK